MNEKYRRDTEKKKEKKYLAFEEGKEGKECPNCGAINELDAKFCAECGYDFSGMKKCPNCGAKIISPNADICEVCGEWLLKGKCKFCGANLEEGAKYCAECGNPVGGIQCSKCGKLSYFDFCPNCGNPLTTDAQKAIKEVKNNPPREDKKFSSNQEARRYFMAQKYLMINHQKDTSQEDKSNEIQMMKSYLEKVEKEKKKKEYKPLFSDKQKESIESIDKVANKEIERQEEERRKKEEAERKRREEEKKRRPKGWLCNFSHTLHPGGPHQCADPSQGGHWVT